MTTDQPSDGARPLRPSAPTRQPPIVPTFVRPSEAPCLDAVIDVLFEFGFDGIALSLKNSTRESLPTTLAVAHVVVEDAVRMLDRAGQRNWATALGRVLPLIEGAASKGVRSP